MNREALRELYDYTTFTWDAYGTAMADLPPEVWTDEIRGAQWTSLREPLFHVATAWDYWFQEHLQLERTPRVPEESVRSWDDLQTQRERTRGWLRRIIEEPSDDELQAMVHRIYPGTDDETVMSLAGVAVHLMLHERGHHGDITTLLSHLGIEPAVVEYRALILARSRAARASA